LFYATVGALEDLGCKLEWGGELPAYARENFVSWKRRNGGLTPPWWKQTLGVVFAGISLVVVGGVFATFFALIHLLNFVLWVIEPLWRALKIIGNVLAGIFTGFKSNRH